MRGAERVYVCVVTAAVHVLLLLLLQAMNHPSPDIRKAAVFVIVDVYKVVGTRLMPKLDGACEQRFCFTVSPLCLPITRCPTLLLLTISP